MRKRIMRSFVLVALAFALVFSTTVAYAAEAPAMSRKDVQTANRGNQTISSSQTGETVKVSNLEKIETEGQTRYTSKTRTYRISFYQLNKKIQGNIVKDTILDVLLAFLKSKQISITLPELLKLLSTISDLVQLVRGGSRNHGLLITVKSYQRTVLHGGVTELEEYWKVTKIKKY